MSEEAHPAIADLSETEFAPLLKIGGANRADLLENTNLGLLFHLGYEFPARLARLRDYLRSNGVMERDLKDLDKRIATANKSQRARAAEKKRKAGLGDDFER